MTLSKCREFGGGTIAWRVRGVNLPFCHEPWIEGVWCGYSQVECIRQRSCKGKRQAARSFVVSEVVKI